MSAEPIIRQPFVCGSCGCTFYDRHECPTIPSQTVPTPRVFIHVPTITFGPASRPAADTGGDKT